MARLNPWIAGNFGQSKAINELDATLGHQRDMAMRTATRLSADLTEVRERAAQVDGRVDVIVNWIDLRFRLLEFDEFEVRKTVRKLLRDTMNSATTTGSIIDIDGYWLPPAVIGTLSGPDSTATVAFDADPLAVAVERDPVRTYLFVFAVGVCSARPRSVESAAARLLAEPVDLGLAPSGRVAEGWRAVWRYAGSGLGDSNTRALVPSRLTELFDPASLDAEELAAWDRTIADFGADTTTIAEALDALRVHLTDATPTTEDMTTSWAGYLRELVDEPSPDERPVVQQLDELHRIDGRSQLSTPNWAVDAGTVAGLLRRDLFDPRGPIALRDLAFEVAGPLFLSRLRALSTSAPEPVTIAVQRAGRVVEVTGEGADPAAVEQAERSVLAGSAVAQPEPGGYLALGAALVATAALMVAVGVWVLAVPLLLGIGAVAHRYFQATDAAKTASLRRTELRTDFHAALTLAQTECRSRDDHRATQHRADQAALEQLIAEFDGPHIVDA